MHNAYNDSLPVPLSDNIVTMRNIQYSLRRSENIAIPRFQSRYLEQSVSYILWNAIASRHPDLTRAERWTLDSTLNKIKVLRDFHLKQHLPQLLISVMTILYIFRIFST